MLRIKYKKIIIFFSYDKSDDKFKVYFKNKRQMKAQRGCTNL